jgi:hypothetical protein
MQGRIDVKNLSIDESGYPSIFPSGLYKNVFNFSVPNHGYALLNATVDVTSDLKYSFG